MTSASVFIRITADRPAPYLGDVMRDATPAAVGSGAKTLGRVTVENARLWLVTKKTGTDRWVMKPLGTNKSLTRVVSNGWMSCWGEVTLTEDEDASDDAQWLVKHGNHYRAPAAPSEFSWEDECTIDSIADLDLVRR